MANSLDIWATAHRDLSDHVFGQPTWPRLLAIRERLVRRGYSLKLDVGKRTTRATVKNKAICAKSTYPSVEDFMSFEEARLDRMEARDVSSSSEPSL